MEKSKNLDSCINCNKTENEAPLLQLKFKGEQMWICSGCMPVLIHNTEKLVERLTNIDNAA